jgi:hypothetical protein
VDFLFFFVEFLSLTCMEFLEAKAWVSWSVRPNSNSSHQNLEITEPNPHSLTTQKSETHTYTYNNITDPPIGPTKANILRDRILGSSRRHLLGSSNRHDEFQKPVQHQHQHQQQQVYPVEDLPTSFGNLGSNLSHSELRETTYEILV